MADPITVLISRHRDPGSQFQEMEQQLAAALAEQPELTAMPVPHLYDLQPDGPVVEQLRAIPGNLIVLSWIYPRATYWVLDANGVRGRIGRTAMTPEEETADPPPATRAGEELPQRTIWCLDLRASAEPAEYLAEIGRLAGVELELPTTAGKPQSAHQEPDAVQQQREPRWYPVIDFGRCTNCLECLNFCLFGVFGLDDEESIAIEEADACRDGCPACSRICPTGAIMFPEHTDPAIAGNGGGGAEGLRLDLSQLFAGADPGQAAAAERDRALAEKQRQESGKDDIDKLVDELDDLEL